MTKAATSVERYSRFFRCSHVDTVLDYGAGTLRNSIYLADQGFTVYAADVPQQVKALRGHPALPRLAGLLKVGDLKQSRLGVDLVVSTYVFNIIVRKNERRRYLGNAVANLRPGGYFLMEVNCRREEAECHSPWQNYLHCDEGSKNYSHTELQAILRPYGFMRICHYYSSHAVAVIFQLTGETEVALNEGCVADLTGDPGSRELHLKQI